MPTTHSPQGVNNSGELKAVLICLFCPKVARTNSFLSRRERIEVRVRQDKEQTDDSPEFLDSLTFMKKFYPLLQVEGAYHSFSLVEGMKVNYLTLALS